MDLTQNPLENAQSLLDDARANRRSQRRRNDRDLLLNLAGQVIGGVLQGRQQEKFTDFMNTEGVLQERAIVRSAVDKAQGFADRARTAASYAGGKRAFFDNELNQTYEAYLQSTLGKDNEYYDQAHVKKIAETLTAETLDEYIQNFDTQLTAAQNVLAATNNDRLAYSKALREASGLDQGVIGRGLRRITSLFRDEGDRDTDSALYRSATSQRIYQESENFKRVFDKFYTKSGNALVADNIAKFLKENNVLEAEINYDLKKVSVYDNFAGKSVEREYLVKLNPSTGKPDFTLGFFDPLTRKKVSPESINSVAGKRQLSVDQAVAELNQLRANNRELESDVNTYVSRYLPSNTFDIPMEIQKQAHVLAGTAIRETSLAIGTILKDTAIDEDTLREIAFNAIQIDIDFNDNPTFLNNTFENALVTYHATAEKFGGAENIPASIDKPLQENIDRYMGAILPSQSLMRQEEMSKYVEANDDIFDNLDSATGITIYDAFKQILSDNPEYEMGFFQKLFN